MGAIRIVATSQLRRHWRGTVVVTLLVGLVGAVTLASTAGARRSSSSLRRFTDVAHSSNIQVQIGSYTAAQINKLRNTPGIDGVGVVDLLFVGPTDPKFQHLLIAAQVDRALGTEVDRPRLVTGRFADPNSVDEINIGEGLAAMTKLRVGDSLDAVSMSQKTFNAISHGGPFRLDGPHFRFRIVGIVRRPLDLASLGSAGGVLLLSPAFDHANRHRIANPAGNTLRVRASDPKAAEAALRDMFGHDPTFAPQDLVIESAGARDAINVLTDVLLIFALVAAIAGLVAIGIVMNRELADEGTDQPALRSLGATRRERMSMCGARVLVIAIGGSIIAVAGAIAASPLLPFGVARRADPDAGLHADWRVLTIGVIAILLALLAIGTVAALRATRITNPSQSTAPALVTRMTAALTGGGLPPAATTGFRMATERGRGENAVPLRSAALGAAFGAFGLTALIVFTSSLGHLSATPRLYGWTFEFKSETTSIQHCDNNDLGVSRLPGVDALAVACYENMDFAGHPTIGWALARVKNDLGPEVVAGRAPRTPNEVALGESTMRVLHTRIGETVHTHGPKGDVVEAVVGQVVFPQLADAQPVADGVWFTPAGWYAAGARDDGFSRFLVGTYAPHADRAAVQREIAAVKGTNPVGSPIVPIEVARLSNISWFPTATAVLLAVLALVAIAHAVITTTRRRRRDLAILKTMGFVRGEVRQTVAWQASALAIAGLLVGIPSGLLVGAVIWRTVAHNIGVRDALVLPLGLVLLVPAVLVAVNAIAFWPARSAARLPAAIALRTE